MCFSLRIIVDSEDHPGGHELLQMSSFRPGFQQKSHTKAKTKPLGHRVATPFPFLLETYRQEKFSQLKKNASRLLETIMNPPPKSTVFLFYFLLIFTLVIIIYYLYISDGVLLTAATHPLPHVV